VTKANDLAITKERTHEKETGPLKIAELPNNLHSDIAIGMAEAAGAIVLCAVVVLMCRRFAVHVECEAAISLVRDLVQMVLVGMVLAVLLHGNMLVDVLILLAMIFTAAVAASLLLCFYAIAAGAGVVIAAMLATENSLPISRCWCR
jgi:putative ABC transport system permease protein